MSQSKEHLLRKPKDKYKKYWKIIDYINMINRESNSVNLYDLGNADVTDSNINYLLNLLDSCIIVVDPLPYKLLDLCLLYWHKSMANRFYYICLIINK